ncbi:MAG TPA: hypothetical protein VFV87_12750 [Pirellulaceae bacterium]|nr:hypothetical protein [Pirellulaceae bacterium]
MSAADGELVVRVASGREFTGLFDDRSDSQSLVLRSQRGSVTIHRPIEWDRIVSATKDGQAVTIDALRQSIAMPVPPAPASDVRTIIVESREPVAGDDEVVQATALEPLPPVTTITFDARIANWDWDVETDGVVLDLLPLDGDGYLAPASGTVQVELYAPQRRRFDLAPQSGGDTLELVERWTRAIYAADFTTSGVRLRLPFGAIHPEFDSDWLAWQYGLVHVRFAAPGHGTFDSSQDGIRMRPWAPNRDQLELNTRRRFLPTEATGRPKESIGLHK